MSLTSMGNLTLVENGGQVVLGCALSYYLISSLFSSHNNPVLLLFKPERFRGSVTSYLFQYLLVWFLFLQALSDLM